MACATRSSSSSASASASPSRVLARRCSRRARDCRPSRGGRSRRRRSHGGRRFTAAERQDAAWFLRSPRAAMGRRWQRGVLPALPAADQDPGMVPGIGPLGAALLVSNACFAGALVMLHGLTRLEGMSREAAARRCCSSRSSPRHSSSSLRMPKDRSSCCRYRLLVRQPRPMGARRPRPARSPPRRGASVCCSCSRSPSRRSTDARGTDVPCSAAARRRVRRRSRAVPLSGVVERGHGDALAPWAAQRNWHANRSAPWRPSSTRSTTPGVSAATGLSTAGGRIVLVAVLAGLRRVRRSYSVYALASLALPLSTCGPPAPCCRCPGS